jgi:DNA-binding CsgD family transcriptional regulator
MDFKTVYSGSMICLRNSGGNMAAISEREREELLRLASSSSLKEDMGIPGRSQV